METLEELRESIKAMSEGVTDTDQVGKIAVVNSNLDKLKLENEELVKKLDETKKLYKDAVLHTAFPEPPKDVVETPKTAEEIIQSIINARNGVK